jgi:hypothetical protein
MYHCRGYLSTRRRDESTGSASRVWWQQTREAAQPWHHHEVARAGDRHEQELWRAQGWQDQWQKHVFNHLFYIVSNMCLNMCPHVFKPCVKMCVYKLC